MSQRNALLIFGLVLVVLGIALFSSSHVLGSGLLVAAIVILIASVSKAARQRR